MPLAQLAQNPEHVTIIDSLLSEEAVMAFEYGYSTSDPLTLGKPTGRDVALGRPSSATEHGLTGAVQHFDRLVACAMEAIPPCRGAGALRELVRLEAERLVPKAWCPDIERTALPMPVRVPARRRRTPTEAA